MGLDVTKINPFSIAMQGTKKVQPSQNPVETTGVISKGSNPSAENNQQKYGVGLVNSDLANMSYRLPKGEYSTCNTIGIA